MLWLVIKGASHQICSCNIHEKEGTYQLWVERPNGKTLKIIESTIEKEVNEVKEAIDFAIRAGQPTLELV